LPLSGLGSIAAHAVILGVALVLAAHAFVLWKNEGRPTEVQVVQIVEPRGIPEGIATKPGGSKTGLVEAVSNTPPAEDRPASMPQVADLKPVPAAPPRQLELTNPDATRLIEEGKRIITEIGGRNDKAREDLARVPPPSNKIEPKGPISGPPRRGPNSPPVGRLEPITREQRWTLIFNTRNGEDYARQLQALGALLAIPDPSQPERYLVIRDLLKRPADPQPEDLSEIDRISWVDSKPESVDALRRALQLKEPPGRFVAFFPKSLEQKLLEMELARARGRGEGEIKETRFEIQRVGNSYEPRVVDQKYLR
jgi:hypothetical protein